MTEVPMAYRWTPEGFLRAWDAGAFESRVELVEGQVWPVVIGDWHGFAVGRVMSRLPRTDDVELTAATLPTGDSLPDPDCWVLHAAAEPVDTVGHKLSRWSPADVLLVVEVSDETVMHDLDIKARLYGRAGYPVYWVVTKDVIYEHTQPTPTGYRTRTEYRAGEQIPVGYAASSMPVDSLLRGR